MSGQDEAVVDAVIPFAAHGLPRYFPKEAFPSRLCRGLGMALSACLSFVGVNPHPAGMKAGPR